MPYGKGVYVSKRVMQRSSIRQGGRQTVAKKATKALRKVNRLSRYVDREKKFFDAAAFASVQLDDNGAIVSVSNIVQGDGGSNRDGMQVKTMSLFVRGTLVQQSATNGVVFSRIIVGYDRESNGALPAITDVLNAITPSSLMNLQNRKRFKILYDKNVYTTLASSESSAKYLKKYKRLQLTLNYADATDVAQRNNLFVIALSDAPNAGAAGTKPTLILNTRLRFTG